MKKVLMLPATFVCLLTLGACSSQINSNQTSKTDSIAKSTSKSLSNPKVSTSNASSSKTISSTQDQKNKNESEKTQTSTLFSGYSVEQIEYARVTETIMNYYHKDSEPISILATKNGTNNPIFPFNGSAVNPKDTITLNFNFDGTMASTIIVTYSSNHNGSINFYKNPNHYQDSRYTNDSEWVNQESKKLLNSSQTIEIPTSFDSKAVNIISKIEIK